jgi:putative RecB family exonuclease
MTNESVVNNESDSTKGQHPKIRYSPTRLSAFDGCKLQYKYYYIDKIPSDIEAIETFRGSMVHMILEEFYKLVKGGAIRPLDWVLDKYKELWDKNYTEDIKIVKKALNEKDYFNKGKQALIDYYDRYKPFNQTKIVDTERMLGFTIKYNGSEYYFHGKLDRLDWNDKDNIFEIHDYKVTNSLMTQEEADTDWQLGLYHIALKDKWPDILKVRLVWHSLLFNKEIVSYRTEKELGELKKALIDKIIEIESCADFPPKKSALCDWCSYQNICPLWKHPKEMETLPVNEYKNDPGVKLVTKYAELEEAKKELKEKMYSIEEEQKKIEDAAIEFAEKNKISIIDGLASQLKIDIKEGLKAPTKTEDSNAWQGLRDILIKEGRYEEVSTVNNNMLNYRIRIWPKEFVEKIKEFLRHQVSKTVRLVKK